MLWGLVLSTPTPMLLIEGRASSRLPFQARDLEQRYGSVSSLAGAFVENGCGVSGSTKGLERRRANGNAYDSLEGKKSHLSATV